METDNAGAIALYERLGFRTHHTARYLTSPAAELPGPQAEHTARCGSCIHGQDVPHDEQQQRAGDDHADDVDAELGERTR